MSALTTKDALLERMVTATETLATDVPAKLDECSNITTSALTNVNGPTDANWILKNNRLIEFFIRTTAMTSLTLNSWNTIAKVPAEFKPANFIDFIALDYTNDGFVTCKLTAGGDLQIYPTKSTTRVNIHVTYLV